MHACPNCGTLEECSHPCPECGAPALVPACHRLPDPMFFCDQCGCEFTANLTLFHKDAE